MSLPPNPNNTETRGKQIGNEIGNESYENEHTEKKTRIFQYQRLVKTDDYQLVKKEVDRIRNFFLTRIEAADMPRMGSDEFILMQKTLTLCRYFKRIAPYVFVREVKPDIEEELDPWES